MRIFIILINLISLCYATNIYCSTNNNTACIDSVCTATKLDNPDGTVIDLGCQSKWSTDKMKKYDNCLHLLSKSSGSSVCSHKNNRTTCCCDHREGLFCNDKIRDEWVYRHSFTLPDMFKAYNMLLTILALIVIYPCLTNIYRLLSHVKHDVICCTYWSIYKLIFDFIESFATLLMIMCIWFPMYRECKQHEEGSYMYNLIFFPALITHGLFVYTFPAIPLLAHIVRLVRNLQTTKFHPMKVLYCNILSIIVSLILSSYAVYLYTLISDIQIQEDSNNYCHLATSCIVQLYMIIVSIGVYVLSSLLSVAVSFRLLSTHKAQAKIVKERSEIERIATETERSLLTARLHSYIENEVKVLSVLPTPFFLDDKGENILSITNHHQTNWIAIRALVSAKDYYQLHPKKMIIPPGKIATMLVRSVGVEPLGKQQGILLQWFDAGSVAPPLDADQIWNKPFYRPVTEWKYYILPIYHQAKTISNHTNDSSTNHSTTDEC